MLRVARRRRARADASTRLAPIRSAFVALPVDEDVAEHYGRALGAGARRRSQRRSRRPADRRDRGRDGQRELHTRDDRARPSSPAASASSCTARADVIRLALRVDRAHAEVALAELLELAPGGVEEVDLGDAVEYAVYGPPGELPVLPDLEAAVGGALIEVTTSELPDDWSERWKQFHHPLVLGEPARGAAAVGAADRRRRRAGDRPGAGVRDGRARDDAAVPGAAAGARRRDAERGPLLDLGCGSGVLAIAAAKLGFEPVVAVDFDPLSVEATRDNAAVNGVDARRRSLRPAQRPDPDGADGARQPAAPAAARLRARLAERGAARAAHADRLRPADPRGRRDRRRLRRSGLHERDRRERGEWAALLLRAR